MTKIFMKINCKQRDRIYTKNSPYSTEKLRPQWT